jgi:hypothetical protein
VLRGCCGSAAALDAYVELLRLSPHAQWWSSGAVGAVSVERWCSRAVQFMIHMLGAAGHMAQVWDAVVSGEPPLDAAGSRRSVCDMEICKFKKMEFCSIVMSVC